MITIRVATSEDLPLCAQLRATYTTRAAWQLAQDGDSLQAVELLQGVSILSFRLQQTRLPRTLALRLPASFVPLVEVWPTYALHLVALQGDHLCGYILLQTLADQQQAMIGRFLVETSAREKGIGTRLLQAACSWARTCELVAVRAHTPLRNVLGATFYQHRGFRVCGLSECFYPNFEDALLLVRLL